jgi:hypothetical protein
MEPWAGGEVGRPVSSLNESTAPVPDNQCEHRSSSGRCRVCARLGPPQGTEVLLDDRLGVFGVVGDYTVTGSWRARHRPGGAPARLEDRAVCRFGFVHCFLFFWIASRLRSFKAFDLMLGAPP